MISNIFINRNFFLIWLGKIISQLGDKFYSIALSWWILQKTNSPSIMGLSMLASVMPGLIFGFLAGTLVDRWNRKKILILSDSLRGALILTLSILLFLNRLEIWQVFTAGISISLVTSFFDPAIQAIIPQIVEKEKLTRANSMSQLVGGACTVAGPLFGAVAASVIGLPAVFLINSISYFLSALMTAFIYYKPVIKEGENSDPIFREMGEGIAFLKKQGDILIIVIIIAAAHFFLGSLMVILPFLAKALTGNGIRNLGDMEMVMGLGLILGSIYLSSKKDLRIRGYNLSGFMIAVGISFLGISLCQYLFIKAIIPYLLLILIVGTAIAFASISWQTMLQNNTPENMTGRVFSVAALAGNISLPAAYGIFGVLLTYSSIMKLTLLSGSALILMCCLLILVMKIKKILL